MMMNPTHSARNVRYASSDISSTGVIGTGSVRTSNSLPFTTYRRGDEKIKNHPQRHRTLTYSADSTQYQPPIIHELQPYNQTQQTNNDFDRRRTVIEQVFPNIPKMNGTYRVETQLQILS